MEFREDDQQNQKGNQSGKQSYQQNYKKPVFHQKQASMDLVTQVKFQEKFIENDQKQSEKDSQSTLVSLQKSYSQTPRSQISVQKQILYYQQQQQQQQQSQQQQDLPQNQVQQQQLQQQQKIQESYGPITPARFVTNESTLQFLLCNCFKTRKEIEIKQQSIQQQQKPQTVSPSSYKQNQSPQTQNQAQSQENPLPEPKQMPLKRSENVNKKTLYIDLDETLVNSSMTPIENADLVFPVQFKGKKLIFYIAIRPYALEFIKIMKQYYEIVIYTASMHQYAQPVIDYIDPAKNFDFCLFRENCTMYKGSYTKDLSLLSRTLKDAILLDNSPHSYVLQPENGLYIESYFHHTKNDSELVKMIPFLKFISNVYDVRSVENWQKLFNSKTKFDYIDMDLERRFLTKGKQILQEQNNSEEDNSSQSTSTQSLTPAHLTDARTEIILNKNTPSIQQKQSTPKGQQNHKKNSSYDFKNLPFSSFQQSNYNNYNLHKRLPSYQIYGNLNQEINQIEEKQTKIQKEDEKEKGSINLNQSQNKLKIQKEIMNQASGSQSNTPKGNLLNFSNKQLFSKQQQHQILNNGISQIENSSQILVQNQNIQNQGLVTQQTSGQNQKQQQQQEQNAFMKKIQDNNKENMNQIKQKNSNSQLRANLSQEVKQKIFQQSQQMIGKQETIQVQNQNFVNPKLNFQQSQQTNNNTNKGLGNKVKLQDHLDMDDIINLEKTFLKRGFTSTRNTNQIEISRVQVNSQNLNSPINKDFLFNEWKKKKDEQEQQISAKIKILEGEIQKSK